MRPDLLDRGAIRALRAKRAQPGLKESKALQDQIVLGLQALSAQEDLPARRAPAGSFDDIDDIPESIRSGEDTLLITGDISGGTGNLVTFNEDGDLVNSVTNISDIILGDPGEFNSSNKNFVSWSDGRAVDSEIPITSISLGTDVKTANYFSSTRENVKFDLSDIVDDITLIFPEDPVHGDKISYSIINESPNGYMLLVDSNNQLLNGLLSDEIRAFFSGSLTGDSVSFEYFDSIGWVTTSVALKPHCSTLGRWTEQPTNPDSTYTKLLVDRIHHDVGKLADITNDRRINIKRSGDYNCSFSIGSQSKTQQVGLIFQAVLYKNGYSIDHSNAWTRSGSKSEAASHVSSSITMTLESNDYLEVFWEGGDDQYADVTSSFSVVEIR